MVYCRLQTQHWLSRIRWNYQLSI